MYKYWQIFTTSWQNGFTYRVSFFLWRLRNLLSTLMSLTIWTVLFAGQQTAFGYSQEQMVSYVFLISVLQSIILASLLHGLANTVYSGDLSKHLLKPISLYWYLAAEETADKLKNLAFTLLEAVLLFYLFKPVLVLPDLPTLALFGLWTLGGALLFFWIQLLFGTLGFWSPDTWGPRFLFFMIVDFAAGKLFPLDILPATVRSIVSFTPLPYLSYIQIQLFLGRLSSTEIWHHSFGIAIWIVLLGGLAHWMWKRGLRDYAAAGQ